MDYFCQIQISDDYFEKEARQDAIKGMYSAMALKGLTIIQNFKRRHDIEKENPILKLKGILIYSAELR